jgi:spermidine synthase
MFPLVTRTYVRNISETGKGVGKLYSANTMGCIFGSLLCGFIFIPLIGTRNTVIMLALINILMAWWLLRSEKNRSRSALEKWAPGIAAIAFIGITFILPDPYKSVVDKIMRGIPKDQLQVPLHKETTTCTITVYGNASNKLDKRLLINGIGMTSLVSETKLMAHLPLLLHYEDPKDMLIICYGMGTCLRSAVTHKNVHTDVVELVGEEYEINNFYHANGKEVLANPRVRHFTDDGRNFLLMHPKKYDVITIDPAPPVWSAGTVNLYTTEFFALCKERLNEDGITCLWIPPAPSTEVKMIMKSFITVYPNTTAYRGPYFPGFYMIGYTGRNDINLQRFQDAASEEAIMSDLNEWDKVAATPTDLLKLKIKDPAELASFLDGVKQVSDDHPYTEFPIWRKITDPDYSVTLYADQK